MRDLTQSEADRLQEIMNTIDDLMHEAKDIFRNTNQYDRFKAYPYGNIMSALNHSGEYMNIHDTTMEDCIESVNVDGDDEDDEA